MAIDYYDYSTGGATTTTGGTWTTVTVNLTHYASNTSSYGTWTHETIYVEAPETWSEEDCLAYVRLLNKETRTGWIVQSLIRGDVLICDPNIQKRSMKDFLPLLLWEANEQDAQAIQAFFEEHPA